MFQGVPVITPTLVLEIILNMLPHFIYIKVEHGNTTRVLILVMEKLAFSLPIIGLDQKEVTLSVVKPIKVSISDQKEGGRME